MPQSLRARVLAALAFIVAAGLTITIVDNGPDHGPDKPRRTITVTLGGPGKDKIALPPSAQTIVKTEAKKDAVDAPRSESDLRDTVAPKPGVLKDNAEQKPDGQPTIPKSLTEAAPSVPGCSTKLVRNYSSRHGAPILLGVIHWTGSRSILNSPADGLAIVRWFDTPAASASSNEITDDDGHCYLVVPETLKSWTQAGFNPWAVSVEHVNPGVLPLFGRPGAGAAAVIRLMRGWHHRWHIPYRRAIVSGCRVIRSGFLAHRDLGACGGGHPDVGPSPATVDSLIRAAAAGDGLHPIARIDRLKCGLIRGWRHAGRPSPGRWERNSIKRRKYLARRGLVCPASGPVRYR